MKSQIKHKGKIFKHLMLCCGYFLYGRGSRRILVNDSDRIIDEYDVTERVRP